MDPASPQPITASNASLLGMIRAGLIVAGTLLAAFGTIGQDDVTNYVNIAMDIVGVALVAGSQVWQTVEKFRAELAAKKRETAAVQAGADAALLGVESLALRAPDIDHAEAQNIIAKFS